MSQEWIYSISIDGAEPVDCEALNLAPQKLTERNGAPSDLVLSQARNLGDSLVLARDQVVRFFINDRCVFKGTVLDPVNSYQDGAVTTTFTAANWWRELQRQPWTVSPWGHVKNGTVVTTTIGDRIVGYDDDTATDPDTISSVRVNTAKSYLFPLRDTGLGYLLPTSVQEQVEALFSYITDRFPTMFEAPTLAFASEFFPQPMMVQDIKVADAIQKALTVMPSVAFRTDYSAETPVITAVDSLVETARNFSLGEWPLKTAEVEALNELVPAGVVMRIGYPDFISGFWQGFQNAWYWLKYPALIRQDDPNVLSLSVDDSPSSFGFLSFTLAQKLYDQLAATRGRGYAAFDDPGLALGLQLGGKLAMAGDHETVDHGSLIIQEVHHTFATCETVCTLGFPPALSLDDLKDRDGWFYRAYWGRFFKPANLEDFSGSP